MAEYYFETNCSVLLMLLYDNIHFFHLFQITGTKFSECVVLNETEEYTSFAEQRDYPERVYFHRTDLEKNPPNDVCNAYQRVSYKSM